MSCVAYKSLIASTAYLSSARLLSLVVRMKFKAGDRVFYPHLGSYGTVQTVINANDPSDVRAQGYRYEVSFNHGKSLWSVLGAALLVRRPSEVL